MNLVLAADSQKKERDRLTFLEWGKGLSSADQFVEREDRLRAHPWAFDAMKTWFLVDTAGDVLSSCETFRMESSVNRAATTKVGASYGFASVYTEPRHRGQGYASVLLQKIMERISEVDAACQAFTLYSEVGARIYERLGFVARPSYDRVFLPMDPSDRSLAGESVSLLLRSQLEATWQRLQCRAQEAFLIWPTASQLGWHFERESIYAQLLQRPVPLHCGAMIGGALLLWVIDFKRGILRGLVMTASGGETVRPQEADVLMAQARLVAGQHHLKELRIWESDGFADWNALSQPGERVSREDGLSMIRPQGPGVMADDWNFIPRALWI